MTTTIAPYTGSSADWDAFASGCSGWTQFHSYGWRDVIERVFGHETIYLGARSARGELTGVLPLVRVRSKVFGHYLVSMPFVNYGGPLGDRESVQLLARHALELRERTGADLLELRSRVELPLEFDASHRKITVTLDLTADDRGRNLWDRLDAKVRSQVRRPTKSGVSYQLGPQEVEPFHTVYAAHMRDLGTPAQPLRFFRALRDAFGDDVWFGCAYLEGRPIAAGCGFRWADEFEMTWASALIRHKTLAANMGLYWHFMEAAMAAGVRTFNFGRCSPGGGTHRFKQQWGSRDEQLWWYGSSKVERASTPSPDDARWSWGPRLWKRLPVPIATALGPHIVRSIP